jgi:hypothetical protein
MDQAKFGELTRVHDRRTAVIGLTLQEHRFEASFFVHPNGALSEPMVHWSTVEADPYVAAAIYAARRWRDEHADEIRDLLG